MGWQVLRVHCLFCTLLSRLGKEEVCPIRGLVRRRRERTEPELVLGPHPLYQLEILAMTMSGCRFLKIIMYAFISHL